MRHREKQKKSVRKLTRKIEREKMEYVKGVMDILSATCAEFHLVQKTRIQNYFFDGLGRVGRR